MNVKFSIILACYNSELFIADCIKSVLDQSYGNFELIIKDGGSTDATLSIIESFSDSRIRLFSCADEGIYDAFNFGLSKVEGNYFLHINSDDVWIDNSFLSSLNFEILNSRSHVLYSDLTFHARSDFSKVLRTWRAGRFYRWKFFFGWMPPHTTCCIDARLIENRRYRTDFKIAGDYEFLSSLLILSDLRVNYLPRVFVGMRSGGASDAGFSRAIIKFREDLVVARGFSVLPWITVLCKKVQKIFQFGVLN